MHPGGEVLIAHDAEGEAIGRIALLPHRDGVFELSKMGVSPRAQGRGVGRLLIEAALRETAERGARRVFLGTNSRLEDAVLLYETVGFHRILRDRLPVAKYYSRADILMERAVG